MSKKVKDEISKGEIIIYKSKEGIGLKVRLEDGTVWLTQKQMAELFEKGIPTINEHIKNIYKENELKENSTIRKFRIVQVEGKRSVERELELCDYPVLLSLTIFLTTFPCGLMGYFIISFRNIPINSNIAKRNDNINP